MGWIGRMLQPFQPFASAWYALRVIMEDELIEQDPGPQIPSEPAQPITSRFLFVDVAALRAKQLRRGARVRFRGGEGAPVIYKAERVAMEEVRRGLVSYDVPAAKGGTAGAEADA
jgi:DNA-directed RNA polymerase subunit K/omega